MKLLKVARNKSRRSSFFKKLVGGRGLRKGELQDAMMEENHPVEERDPATVREEQRIRRLLQASMAGSFDDDKSRGTCCADPDALSVGRNDEGRSSDGPDEERDQPEETINTNTVQRRTVVKFRSILKKPKDPIQPEPFSAPVADYVENDDDSVTATARSKTSKSLRRSNITKRIFQHIHDSDDDDENSMVSRETGYSYYTHGTGYTTMTGVTDYSDRTGFTGITTEYTYRSGRSGRSSRWSYYYEDDDELSAASVGMLCEHFGCGKGRYVEEAE